MPPDSTRESTLDIEWTLRDYIDLFLRRKTLILATFAIFVTAALVYTFVRPPQYYAAATFMIESPNMGLGSLLGSQVGRTIAEPGRPIEFYDALLQSQAYSDLLFQQVRGDSIIRAYGLGGEELYQIQRKHLKLETSAKTDLVRLGVTARAPQLAWRFATIATEVFKMRCRQIELEETRNVVDYVDKQKDISRGKLEDAERSLQEFNESTSFAVSDEDGGLLKKLVELEGQLAEVQSQRELAEANISAYNQRLNDLKAPNTPELNDIDTPRTKELRSKLDRLVEERTQLAASGQRGTKAIALDQQIDEVRNQLYQAILATTPPKDTGAILNQNLWEEIRQNRIKEELQLYMLRNRERFFQRQVDTYRRQNPKLIERAIEMTRLQRSKKVYEDMFAILLEKGEEARIKSATGTGGIRIIDMPTVPQRPVPSNIPRNLSLGLFLGLGMGFGLAILRDYMDNTIHNSDDLTRHTGLPVMGSVPVIKSIVGSARKPRKRGLPLTADLPTNGYADHLIAQMSPRDPVVDAYRTLRTNLQFASVDQPISALLVTSALPGEGKTLSSANIAISFAELGQRVLLIDGDLRKPKQHELFGIKSTPGLSDYMAKNLNIGQVIYPTSVPNLRLVPCGTIPPNPAEMIASQRMTEFLTNARMMFDMVVVDAPPLRVVTDPLLFAGKVTHVLLVVKFESTQMRDVQEAITLMRRAQTQILGALFNAIKMTRGYGYYHRYDYYYTTSTRQAKKKS
jgi:tyrosine-protein kinase Etk/Wzc